MKLLAAILFAITVWPLRGAIESNPLIGTWRLNREATAAYLREHRILPESAIQKLFAAQHSAGWRFDQNRVYGTGHEAAKSMPYRIVARSGLIFKLVATNEEDGKQSESTIHMDQDGNGYWQETSMIAGYRERVERVETREAEPGATDNPDDAQ